MHNWEMSVSLWNLKIDTPVSGVAIWNSESAERVQKIYICPFGNVEPSNPPQKNIAFKEVCQVGFTKGSPQIGFLDPET